MDNWNHICEIVKDSYNDKEELVQQKWVRIITEFFGWSTLKKEIEVYRNIQMGSLGRTIPDIVIKNNDKDLFVIELKQHNKSKTTSYVEQLKSYMSLLKLNLGILICDSIYIYYSNPKKGIDFSEIKKIDFSDNSEDYKDLFSLIHKVNFSEQIIDDYAESVLELQTDVKKIKTALNTDFILSAVKEKLSLEFSNSAISTALKMYRINIEESVERKTKYEPELTESKLIEKGRTAHIKITEEMIDCVWNYFLIFLRQRKKIGDLADEVAYKSGMNRGSAFIYLNILKNLSAGQLNKRAMKHSDLNYYINKFNLELGDKYFDNIIVSLERSIIYWNNHNSGYAREVAKALNSFKNEI